MITITRYTWKLVILLFIGSLAVTVSYLYISLSSTKPDMTYSNQVQSSHLPGSLTLNTITGNTHFAAGADVYVTLSGSSAGIPISGYDGVISYNPDVLTFVESTNNMADYDIFTAKKDGSIILTGSLKLTTPSALPLQDSILATAHFSAKQAGEADTIMLVFTPGSKTDSNMLSDKTEDILGTVIGIGDTARTDNVTYVQNQILVAYKPQSDPEYLKQLVTQRAQERTEMPRALGMAFDDIKVHLSYQRTPEEMLVAIETVDKKSGVIAKKVLTQSTTEDSKVYQLTLNGSVTVPEVISMMSALSEVQYAQPDYIYQPLYHE